MSEGATDEYAADRYVTDTADAADPTAPTDPTDGYAAEIAGLRIEAGTGEGRRVLVDGVSLRLRAGAVTGLVGASGSGKTTTGLALLGEHPAGARVEGEVHVRGGGPVGYVPQHPAAALNPVRRAGALLGDIARPQVRSLPRRERRAAAHARVLGALEAAQLPDGEHLLRRHPHQLSGGQQQRVVLAQALLLGAQVVVADEPTTGQDALTKRRIVDELAAVARQGIAVLLLSHDLDVVRELADETVVLHEGRVVESGPTRQLFAAPEQDRTRELLTAQPEMAPSAPVRRAVSEDGAGELSVRIGAARYRDRERGTVTALNDITLTAATGECLALVGRSGSGKTTLGRCLAGLHRDWDGTVSLDGQPLPRSLRNRTPAQLAAVQYVFQDARASFDEHRTVLAQTARTAVRLRRFGPEEAEDEARTVLARVGLDAALCARRPALLSGGELQRAALARALLARPRVLVCDEITSGLDAVTRRAVLTLLTDLRSEREETSLVLITHDLDTAALAHRVAVLDGGEVVEQGAASRVLTEPEHPFTASLVAASHWEAPTRT